MNTKTFLILILLAFFVINTASAADNITCDDLAIEEDALNKEVLTSDENIRVDFKEQMWEENLSDIDVELPEDASGDFCVKIDDEIIYNKTITEKSFKVPIILPNRGPELVISIWPPVDCKYYKVSAFYNGIDLNVNKTLKVMKFSPDYNYFNFPQEILQNDKYPRFLTCQHSANGIVEVYIDNKLFLKTEARSMISLENMNPDLGTHYLRVIYSNDTYYHDVNKTFEFNVVRAVIDIPDVVNISHDDCIAVRTPENTEGTVMIYLDSKLIKTEKIDDDYYVFSLEKYITPDTREVTVTLTTPDFTRTKTKSVKMYYDFDIFIYSNIYGTNNLIEIMLPDYLNNDLLDITLDGVKFNFKRQDLVNNALKADVSKLAAGNHSLVVSYPGDAKFYPYSKTYNFTIEYKIQYPYIVTYSDESKVYLKLPDDAKGNLVVYMDGMPYKSSKFINGYAEVLIDSLKPGVYNFDAFYDGDDYSVSKELFRISARPKIDFDYGVLVGDNKFITLEVPKDCKGFAVFHINGKVHNVSIVDGIARYSLKNLKVGEYEIYVDYYGEDGYNDLSNWCDVLVYAPKIKVLSSEGTFKSIYMKIKLLDFQKKPVANKWILIKFNGKKYKVKTNKKGVAILKKSSKIKNKKIKVKLASNGAKLIKKLKIKPVFAKAIVKKNKLIIKAYIHKKIKNRIVSIKINGKTFRVKTNKGGIAKLSVKKPKKPHVRVIYLKSAIKLFD